MARRLATTREVFHAWASRRHSNGLCGNVRFDGPVLFSYAEPIAYLLDDERVMIRSERFSVTTSSHQSLAASAVHHTQRIYAPHLPSHPLSEPEDIRIVHAENDRRWLKQADELRARYLENKRKTSVLRELNTVLTERDTYSTFFELGWTRPSMGEIDARLAEQEIEFHRQALARHELAMKLAQENAEEQQEALADWRKHIVRRYPYFEQTALRLSQDLTEIETSKGAKVPVSVAETLWKLAQKCRAACTQYVPANVHFSVGDYRLLRVENDGSLVIGCHTIPFSELEPIAEQLGLCNKEAAHV
ncbi:hypothetical protein [Uliginosibacterium gangwonense]|uniref:hypothetical protein n=1 Tax=Uliginosibacterium gangwonense TaxID=392736 RepID=UPI0003664B2F|nr:hypothetical protein [Uliginosibacterium gangwonense]